jgi:hypothetical protein
VGEIDDALFVAAELMDDEWVDGFNSFGFILQKN